MQKISGSETIITNKTFPGRVEFQQRLEEMLEGIKFTTHKLSIRATAYDWEFDDILSEYFQEVKKYIFLYSLFGWQSSLGEFGTKKIELTSDELLLNARVATDSSSEHYIEYTAYFGRRGIVIHVKDDGPGFEHELAVQERKPLAREVSIREFFDPKYTLPGGTGVYCLLKFTNDFAFNEQGNEVIARFKPR